jgi:DNA-binding transcriptional regulator YdaS (Cro superfamily)
MKKEDAIAYFGSSSELAKKLGIAKQAISQWGEDVPQLRAFEIERITNSALKADFIPFKQPKKD